MISIVVLLFHYYYVDYGQNIWILVFAVDIGVYVSFFVVVVPQHHFNQYTKGKLGTENLLSILYFKVIRVKRLLFISTQWLCLKNIMNSVTSTIWFVHFILCFNWNEIRLGFFHNNNKDNNNTLIVCVFVATVHGKWCKSNEIWNW